VAGVAAPTALNRIMAHAEEVIGSETPEGGGGWFAKPGFASLLCVRPPRVKSRSIEDLPITVMEVLDQWPL
jgi:hypothetical protein